MIRVIFYLLIVGHAVIHFLGFAQAWDLSIAKDFEVSPMISLSVSAYKIVGVIWLLGSVAFISVSILHALEKRTWWIIGIVALIFSQSLIVLYWHEAIYGTLVNLILLIPILLAYFEDRFDKLTKGDVSKLMSSQTSKDAAMITTDSIEHLPPVVQRWLIRSNVVGKEKIRTVHVRQKGMMRSKAEGRWMPMNAEQFITTDPPGFVWRALIKAGGFLTISGRDAYRNGKGSMLIKAMNVLTLAKSSGKEIDQGAMMRYLAEIMWFPSAALSDYIRWEYIDESKARAVIHHGNMAASGVFSFNKDGDVTGFEGKRYGDFNDLYSLETWSIAVKGYQEFNGIRIGSKSEVTWKLKQGDFTWLKIEITDLTYNISNDVNTQSSVSMAERFEKLGDEKKLAYSDQRP